MKHLITYKLFEGKENEDFDSLGRFDIFQADAQLAFDFAGMLITERDEIINLIKVYNETYISNGEWNGGPVNNEFRKYFGIKYEKMVHGSAWKPLIALIIKPHTESLEKEIIGFSIRNKECVALLDSQRAMDIDETKPDMSEYDEELQKSVHSYLHKIYNKHTKLDTVIEELDLNIDKIDWEWKDDINESLETNEYTGGNIWWSNLKDSVFDIFTPLFVEGFDLSIYPRDPSSKESNLPFASNILISLSYKNPNADIDNVFYGTKNPSTKFYYEEFQDEMEHTNNYLNSEGYKLKSIDYMSSTRYPGHRVSLSPKSLGDMQGEIIFGKIEFIYTKI